MITNTAMPPANKPAVAPELVEEIRRRLARIYQRVLLTTSAATVSKPHSA